MAVTKLWSRRNDGSASAGSIIADTIDYACNPDKTKNLEVTLVDEEFLENGEVMENVLKYVVNDNKTKIRDGEFANLEEVLVSGLNCRTETADEEFMQVKDYWNKTDKNLLWHGVQSFSPGEVDPKTAHEIGIKLAQRMWEDKYQVIVTTHCDRAHIHNHFVFNSVSFKDGKKYHYSNSEIYHFRNESDLLCHEYGLSVIEETKGRGVNYYEWMNGNSKKTVRALIKEDIDEAIMNSGSLSEVFNYLENNLGYEINRRGKYITLKPPGRDKAFRLDNIDKNRKNPQAENNYTAEAIVKRINDKNSHFNLKKTVNDNKSYKQYHISVKNNCFDALDYIFESKTIRGLYWHYFYLLKNPKNVKRNYTKEHFKIRREAQQKIKRYSERLKYVTVNNISSEKDLNDRISKIKDNISKMEEKRSDLRNQLQFDNSELLLAKIEQLNQSIASNRKELYLCNDIKKNSKEVDEKLKSLEQKKQEERNKENGSRRSGSRYVI